MTKEKLLSKLNTIIGNIEDFESDALDSHKLLKALRNEVEEITQAFEDDDVDLGKPSERDEE